MMVTVEILGGRLEQRMSYLMVGAVTELSFLLQIGVWLWAVRDGLQPRQYAVTRAAITGLLMVMLLVAYIALSWDPIGGNFGSHFLFEPQSPAILLLVVLPAATLARLVINLRKAQRLRR
jgi:hypothetical protein